MSLSHLPKGNKADIEARLDYRKGWLDRALKATEGYDIVFFDPDNGLEVKSTKAHHDKGPKFTFFNELVPFWKRGQSLVIYQHKNMHQKAEVQIAERKQQLFEALGYDGEVGVHYYPRFGGRMFFVLVNV